MTFPTKTFRTKKEIYKVPIKGDFHRGACRHEYKKGKYVEDKRTKDHLKKDIIVCIKCGNRKGKP